MVIYTQYKFHEILSIGYLVMAKDGKKNHWNLDNQPAGNNSSIFDDTLMKLHVNNHTMVVYIQYEFYENSIHWFT